MLRRTGTDLPRAMSLTLLDSNMSAIDSELVPFAQSYDVSCLPYCVYSPFLTEHAATMYRRPFCMRWRHFLSN